MSSNLSSHHFLGVRFRIRDPPRLVSASGRHSCRRHASHARHQTCIQQLQRRTILFHDTHQRAGHSASHTRHPIVTSRVGHFYSENSLLRVTSAKVGHATPPANAQLKLPRLDDPSALHLRTALQDGRCSTSRMAAVLRRTSRYFCASSSARRTRLRASSTWSRESQICRKEAEMAAYATTAFRGEEEGRFCRDTKGRYAS